jgi:hypothetical protein
LNSIFAVTGRSKRKICRLKQIKPVNTLLKGYIQHDIQVEFGEHGHVADARLTAKLRPLSP